MARLVCEAFGTSKRVTLPLAKQAWTMLKRDVCTPHELEEAIRMAFQCPKRRETPRTMWFFSGWVEAFREWTRRLERQRSREKERAGWVRRVENPSVASNVLYAIAQMAGVTPFWERPMRY